MFGVILVILFVGFPTAQSEKWQCIFSSSLIGLFGWRVGVMGWEGNVGDGLYSLWLHEEPEVGGPAAREKTPTAGVQLCNPNPNNCFHGTGCARHQT